MNKIHPSFTHLFFLSLEKAGYLKHIVSQNTDGVFMRSGFNMNKITELHGNRYMEICKKCDIKYFRDFITR